MSQKTDEEVNSITIFAGLSAFFVILYFSIVLYRRIICHMSWLDSCSFNPREQRIVRANQQYLRNDAESTPRRATVVRFKMDEEALHSDND